MSRGWKILAGFAIVLAAASIALSAWLFAGLHDVAVRGCERQNHLRSELNRTLIHFQQQPRFGRIDCEHAYRLHPPFH